MNFTRSLCPFYSLTNRLVVSASTRFNNFPQHRKFAKNTRKIDNRLRLALDKNEQAIGHMVIEFATRGMPRLLEQTTIDFVVIDMEHSGFGFNQVSDLLSGFHKSPVTPMVRIPYAHYDWVSRVLDSGAKGIMLPNCKNVEEAQLVIDAAKYAPEGKRGLCGGIAHTSYLDPPDVPALLRYSNANTTIICQIESVEGVANADAIAALPEVDVLWIGHFDLSVSLGIPGEFQHPKFIDAVDQVVTAAKKHGKGRGVQPGDRKMAKEWMERDFNIISFGGDTWVYKAALLAGAKSVRRDGRKIKKNLASN